MYNKKISISNYLLYAYVPTLIFLVSQNILKNIDLVFSGLFFTCITITSISSFYIVNRSLAPVSISKLLGLVIPLNFLSFLFLGYILFKLSIL
ncbi:hypothetical protein IGI80_003766 [Enterococcus sp. DIV1420a]